jgi:K+-sensing histidine kinase KdpD
LSRSNKSVAHTTGHASSDELRTGSLRSTAIDSLAQAYKTPLTVILAASAGLSEIGELSGPQADLVALIEEQASLLTDITAQLLAAARMDASDGAIGLNLVGVEPMIDDAVARLKARLASLTISIDIQDEGLVLSCDRQLIILLLAQFLDHARTYSFQGTTITLRAAQLHTKVVFSVHSFRPVIPAMDLESIFEPDFPFSAHGYHAAGPGIGLSLARRVAAIHSGTVWVDSKEVEGTTFYAAIPSQVA